MKPYIVPDAFSPCAIFLDELTNHLPTYPAPLGILEGTGEPLVGSPLRPMAPDLSGIDPPQGPVASASPCTRHSTAPVFPSCRSGGSPLHNGYRLPSCPPRFCPRTGDVWWHRPRPRPPGVRWLLVPILIYCAAFDRGVQGLPGCSPVLGTGAACPPVDFNLSDCFRVFRQLYRLNTM